ncbi:MAG: magnesium/cobalt transporter CorA [Chthoniobacteraceae bacterium]
MFKKRYSRPGDAPATLHSTPGASTAVVIKLMEYDRNGCEERTLGSVADLPDCRGASDGKIRWIEFNGLGDVTALKVLGEKFGLHPLALEDVLNVGQRPKLEPYPGHLFMVAQMIYHDAEHCLCGEQVSMFVCGDFLISIQEDSETDVFDPVRQRIRTGGGNIRSMKSDYLAYALLDAIVDHGFPVLEEIGESLQEIEDAVLAAPSKDTIGALHGLKRTLMQLRRFVWPERDVVNSLLHGDSEFVHPETKVYLRDLYDHTVQIMDLIEAYRDVATSLMDMYLSSVGLRTNEIMRVLTVIASIFIPLTFLAGVYGMNFEHMPELHTQWGYAVFWVVMVVIAVGQLVFFHRKKWL